MPHEWKGTLLLEFTRSVICSFSSKIIQPINATDGAFFFMFNMVLIVRSIKFFASYAITKVPKKCQMGQQFDSIRCSSLIYLSLYLLEPSALINGFAVRWMICSSYFSRFSYLLISLIVFVVSTRCSQSQTLMYLYDVSSPTVDMIYLISWIMP